VVAKLDPRMIMRENFSAVDADIYAMISLSFDKMLYFLVIEYMVVNID
jgi:hypothetical protein